MYLKVMCVACALTMACARALATSYTDNCVVYTCPHCGAKAHETEYASWNTIGAFCWSDGFTIAPMAPTDHIVARCWKCRKAFDKFRVKSTTVSRKEYLPNPDSKIKWIGDFDAVKEVLSDGKGALEPDLEGALRLCMLWASNHARRKSAASGDELVQDAVKSLKIEKIPDVEIRENMVRLSAMTNLPLLLRAEVCREMGDFAGAKKLLDEHVKLNKGEDADNFPHEVKKRIDDKDSCVFRR